MEKQNENIVSKESAFEHAVANMLIKVHVGLPGLEAWRGAQVDPEPLEIYDLNGHLLFYEFSVERDGKIVGRMKASASKVIGPAVFTDEAGPRRWNADKARDKATKIARDKFKDAEIGMTRLVCYSYPKIGILIEVEEPKTREKIDRIIVDAGSLEVVPLTIPEEGFEGLTVWSMLDRIPEGEKLGRIKRWESDDRLLDFLKNEAEKAKIDIRGKISDKEREKIDDVLKRVIQKRDIRKKPNEPWEADKNQPESGGFPLYPYKTLDFELHGQENNCWCAVATGQMILKYHNYYYEQNDIAVAMNSAPPRIGCGTAPDQSPGYESLSRNYLDGTFDGVPTWEKARDEINEDRPLKTGSPGHARACAGHSLFFIFLIFTGEIIVWRYLQIYDPWPPDSSNTFCNPSGGEIRWEEWDSIVHTNYVYVVPCAGTMKCGD